VSAPILEYDHGFLFVGKDENLYHAVFQATFWHLIMSPKASPHWSVAYVETEYGNTAYAGGTDTRELDRLSKDVQK
jgi:hypothetical protein